MGLGRAFNYLSFMVTSIFGLFRAKRPDYIFVESPPLFIMLPARLFAFLWRRVVEERFSWKFIVNNWLDQLA